MDLRGMRRGDGIATSRIRTPNDLRARAGMRSAGLAVMVAAGALACAQTAFAAPPLPSPSPARDAASSGTPGAGKPVEVPPMAGIRLDAAEREFRAAVAEMAKEILPPAPDREEAKRIVQALVHIRNRNLAEARVLQEQVTDPIGKRLIDWLALRVGYGAAEDYVRFLSAHPHWPDETLLRRRMEQALFKTGGDVAWIRSVFERWPPVSSVGLAVQASAALARGDKTAAEPIARSAWCRLDLPSSFEDDFLSRLGSLLRTEDHVCRLEHLLITHLRGRGARASRAGRMRPVIKLLPDTLQPKYTARLSMFLRQPSARDFIEKVPQAQRVGDAGFAFQYAAWLRRSKKHAAAWDVLAGIGGDAPGLVNRDAWWTERRAQAVNALKEKRYKVAFDLVRRAIPDDVNDAKDQAFFAGWIALNYLRQPRAAIEHFARMRKLADGPLSRSKSAYWLAAAHRRAGDRKTARVHLRDAAGIRDTFHGLLARETLGQRGKLALALPPRPSQDDVAALKSSELLKAAILTQRLGLDRLLYTLRFFRDVGENLKTPGQFVLMAQLGRELGDGQLEVRFGKAGVAAGHPLYIYAYPIDLLPAYKPLRDPVEPAMLLAIARQESEFNTRIVSRAGARGLLQVMPITARHICRQYKIPCRISELLRDPVYNARIASAYIADRKDDFGGSYILTLTGYNAGPGRTRQWLGTLGDPRERQVRPLDWIYRIPFGETRRYVQKVLSNVQVYRARLGQKNPLRLVRDMRRGRS